MKKSEMSRVSRTMLYANAIPTLMLYYDEYMMAPRHPILRLPVFTAALPR
jgi:hypothetical protein